MYRIVYTLAAFAMLLTACSSTASPVPEPPNTGQDPIVPNRPSSFANDDAFLDYIQKVHFNYMWEGAEPTSGLAPERIHLDGIYPSNDKHVVTTGGSGF
ncbi:MAG: beta-glucosidase, partial [Bacteroidales bacterium]|nr:beta-glucosidase [Bacteroidales bacterium]